MARRSAALTVCALATGVVLLSSTACVAPATGSGLFDTIVNGVVGHGSRHRDDNSVRVQDFEPVQEPFNTYLSSLQVVLQTYTIDTHDIEITLGPVSCSKTTFGGASVKPDSKVVAINTSVEGLAVACQSPFEAKYKFMKANGTMTASVKNASMTTAVSPLKGKKPAANAEIPDAIDMFGCSMNAGDVDIDFQGNGPAIALLEKLKDAIKDAVVTKVETTACEEIQKVVNQTGTSVLAYLVQTFLVPESLK